MERRKTDRSADKLEGNAAALEVDFDDADADVLVDLEDVGGAGDPAAAAVGAGGPHAGDVDQAVLLDTEIHEGSEVGHVGNYAGQFHAGLQVLDRRHAGRVRACPVPA